MYAVVFVQEVTQLYLVYIVQVMLYCSDITFTCVYVHLRSVVFNYRGCGNTRLSTPVLYCPGKVDDLEETICHIKRRYPKSPLMAVGTSLGGYALN